MQPLHALLGQLMGRHATIDGIHCEVIDILKTDTVARVVLAEVHGQPMIQPDQHGEPHRRVGRTFTLSILNEEGRDLHPVISHIAGDALAGDLFRTLFSNEPTLHR